MRNLLVLAAWGALAGCGSVGVTKMDADNRSDGTIDTPTSCPVGATAICVGDQLATCDVGAITGMQPCELGCNATESRCNKLAPSNGLAAALDSASSAPDVTFVGATTIDTDQGTITDQSGARALPTAIVNSTPVNLFVIKVKSLTTGGDITVRGTQALAIVSAGDVSIGHVLSVSASFQNPGPGAVSNDNACKGGPAPAGNSEGGGGGGGGGFGTAGGAGGVGGSPTVPGGNPGGVVGNPELVPLRGGCPGGRPYFVSSNTVPGAGGGAFLFVSNTAVRLTVGGSIAANGGGGAKTTTILIGCLNGTPCGDGEGAGAGGGILVEAPVVELAPNSGVYANGGGGMCNVNGFGTNGLRSAIAAPGQSCSGQTGNGGNGAAGSSNAQDGVGKTGTAVVGGGGGGGRGRIRFNIPVGTTFSPSGTVSGAMTVGSLQTR
jgi:hypothetical protein